MTGLSPEERRSHQQHDVGDQIVEAFASLECVQILIPAGYAIHVKCVWDDKRDGPLPVGMLLTLSPLDDIPGDAVQLP